MKIKKILCLLILCGLCIFTITGCGSNSKATIINNENETENLTAKDLYKINNENEAKFKKYYVGAKITFDGTVSSVETNEDNCYENTSYVRLENDIGTVRKSSGSSDQRKCAIINFKEGYKLMIPSGETIDIADISNGDKYHVESNIASMWNKQVECFGIDEDKVVDFDLTKMILK